MVNVYKCLISLIICFINVIAKNLSFLIYKYFLIIIFLNSCFENEQRLDYNNNI